MKISAIVAATDNDVISKNGVIPWKMPSDEAYTIEKTNKHPVIMGHGTYDFVHKKWFDSLVIVVSRNPNLQLVDGQILASSVEQALALPQIKGANEVFIFGGQPIYEAAMPYTQRIYLTRIHATIDGDRFFKYNPHEWVEVSKQSHQKDEQNPYDYDFIVLERKNPIK